MQADIKKQWLEALRSGKYKQGAYALRSTDDKFCCLGVLCDLHSKATGKQWSKYGSYLGTSSVLPAQVVAWAELSDVNPLVAERGLIDHNDGITLEDDDGWKLAPLTFNGIADLIEKEL